MLKLPESVLEKIVDQVPFRALLFSLPLPSHSVSGLASDCITVRVADMKLLSK